MTTRRGFLASATGLGAVVLAGCLGDESTDGPTVTPADGAVATAPLGDTAAPYAMMGTDGPLVTYFGSWKCPFCARFEEGPMRDIVTDYIEPGALRLEYLPVGYRSTGDPFLGPDAPRAARAGIAVWENAPERYWPYHATVHANQPPENEQWATTDRLVGFARAVGVEPIEPVREDIESGAHDEAVREAARRAFEDVGISGTPTLVVDGEPLPALDEERVRSALDAFAGQ